MKKKRPITEVEKKLNQIRSANRREGYWQAYYEWQKKFADKILVLGQEFADAKRQLDMKNGISFEEHESVCRHSRAEGYETGVLVGTENTRAELREFYEKQRRRYMAVQSPLAEPILSPWEMFSATNTTNARGNS